MSTEVKSTFSTPDTSKGKKRVDKYTIKWETEDGICWLLAWFVTYRGNLVCSHSQDLFAEAYDTEQRPFWEYVAMPSDRARELLEGMFFNELILPRTGVSGTLDLNINAEIIHDKED